MNKKEALIAARNARAYQTEEIVDVGPQVFKPLILITALAHYNRTLWR